MTISISKIFQIRVFCIENYYKMCVAIIMADPVTECKALANDDVIKRRSLSEIRVFVRAVCVQVM